MRLIPPISTPWTRRHLQVRFIITLILILFLAGGILNLRVDPSIDRIFPGDHPVAVTLEKFKHDYINDKVILVGIEAPGLFRETGKVFLKKLASEIARLPDVEKVLGLPTLNIPRIYKNKLSFSPAIDLKPEFLRKHPFLKNTFISTDGDATLLQIYPKTEWSPQFQNQLDRLLKKITFTGAHFYFGGMPLLEKEIVRSVFHDLLILTPLAIGLIFIFLWFLWRNIFLAIICMAVVLATLGTTLGIMGWANRPITIMTSVLPPLLLSIGMATAVHILSAIRSSNDSSIELPLTQVFRPCLFTTLTTAAGFGSLYFNPILYVKDFGLISLVGILVSLLIAFGLIPFLCQRHIYEKSHFHRSTGSLIEKSTCLSRKYSRLIIIIFTSAIVLSFILMPRLKMNVSAFDYINPDGDTSRGYRFFQNKFSGVSTLELDIRSPDGHILDPENIKALRDLSARFEADPRVNKVISIASFIGYLQTLLSPGDSPVPPSRQAAAQLLFLYRLSGYGFVVNDYVTKENTGARVSIMVGNFSASEFSSLILKVKKYCDTMLPPSLSYQITGSAELYAQVNQILFKGLLKSLTAAFLLIGFLMLVFLKSWRLGLISFLPNLFPLAVAFGFTALYGIRMDIQTAMVGCISLGISVDGTIHLLNHYQAHPEHDLSHTWNIVGQPVLMATLTLISVFSLFIFASLKPTQTFGLLTALALVSALAGDLIYLPAILTCVFRNHSRKEPSRTNSR